MAKDGTQRRLRRILPRRGSIILPVDGALIDGPLGALADPAQLFSEKLLSNIDSILGFRGLLNAYDDLLTKVGFIVNLSASTTLSTHTHKRLVSSVESAIRSGADGVCFQIHLSDEKEGEMLHDLGTVVTQAERWGIPVLTTAYPRRSSPGGEDNYQALLEERPDDYTRMVAHVVRVAVEMGTNVVKTVYTGSIESFKEVVRAACGVPVVVAGGAVSTDSEAEAKAISAVSAGAWGIAYGRQIFMNENPVAITCRLRKALDDVVGDETHQ